MDSKAPDVVPLERPATCVWKNLAVPDADELALTELARLISRRLADWCLIFTQAESGGLHCAALAHRDRDNEVRAADFVGPGAQTKVLVGP